MSFELTVFLAVVFMTFVSFQLFWDGQLITYPMFRWIQQQNEAVFVHVHQSYVKHLGIPTYLPMGLYLGVTMLFLFVRPAQVPIQYPIIMNVLNAVGVVSTFTLLVPLHIRIDRTERASLADVNRLIVYNTVRFGALIINSVIVLYLLTLMLG
ncbi:MAG: hypothetical protein SF123_13695 [Chloroflexota bacterium]|nr:hypothetical protein [Chloroflexota bacterium]